MRSAPHVQPARQDSFRRNPPLDAVLHRLARSRRSPRELELQSLRQLAFGSCARIRAHSFANITSSIDSPCAMRDLQQLCSAVKRIRKLAPPARLPAVASAPSSTMNPPPIEKYVRSTINCSRIVVSRNPQSVRMLRSRSRRKHRCAIEQQIPRLVELDGSPSRKLKLLRCADLRHRRSIAARIDGRRFIPRQTQQHRAVRSVPHPSQRQRPVKLPSTRSTRTSRPSIRGPVQSGTRRASAPWCANSKVQRQIL